MEVSTQLEGTGERSSSSLRRSTPLATLLRQQRVTARPLRRGAATPRSLAGTASP